MSKARGNLQTIDIHGKPYVTVAERVKAVTDLEDLTKNRYDIERWKRFEVNNRHFVTCYIRVILNKFERDKDEPVYDYSTYSGTAEIKFDGKGVDATNPYENAETSALGRALAFAGVGLIDGIASADEVVRAQGNSEPQLATSNQKNFILDLFTKKGVSTTDMKTQIEELIGKPSEEMTMDDASTVIESLK